MSRIEHPPLAFDEHGSPYSTLFKDGFRSRDGALAESEEVFVRGCDVEARWRGGRRMCVLEVGFGCGLNLLATVHAFRRSAPAHARLDYVSVEAHPLSRADLAAAHRAYAVHDSPLLRELVERWPPAMPGLHRLALDGGRIHLLVALGEAGSLLPQLQLRADTLYLDGFAPSRNPSAWEPRVLRQLARLAAPGARLATYSAAAAAREGLTQAGFEVERVAGFGRKRERLNARYAPRWKTWAPPAAPPHWEHRHAAVVGAGLAGATLAARLVSEGWRVSLIDRHPQPGGDGSRQPWIADHIHLSSDDNRLARLTRAALLLREESIKAELVPIGRLALAKDSSDWDHQRQTLDRLGFPSAFASLLDARQASELAGCRLPGGGIWIPGAMAARPVPLIESLVKQSKHALTWMGGREVSALRRDEALAQWELIGADGSVLSRAPVVVLCEATHAVASPALRSLPLRRVRGQTSWVQHPALAGLRTILGGAAYAVPDNERTLIGATYDDHDAVEPDRLSDQSNARRLATCLGVGADSFNRSTTSASVGFRWTAADRLPVIGALPDEAAADAASEALAKNDRLAIPRHAGLFCARGFGSRGLLWSGLAADIIASALTGGPGVLERDLAEAVDPARGVRQTLRRNGGLTRSR
jgi:tRNA 5-methylaminomethyl-2-thiouridine biosynthesis bifunctional protein